VTAPTSIPDIFDNTRQWVCDVLGDEKPAFNRLSTKSLEGDIIGVNERKTRVSRFVDRIERKLARCCEGVCPEGIKVGRLGARRLVYLKLIEREVKLGHFG
jgi:hypothetical protein